jgi:PAS domain S-box-containing protein
VATVLLALERRGKGTSANLWIAGALISMGALDAFHAVVHAGDVFVWLHSTATFVGGLMFALVWLPATGLQECPRGWVFWVCGAGVALGVGSLLFPEALPTMVRDSRFTPAARWLNIAGGVLFFSAAARLIQLHRRTDNVDDLLFCLHCTLFGAAAIMFEQSQLWDAPWWGWHLLRLAAYGVALWFVLRVELRSQDALKVSEKKYRTLLESLPQRIYYKDTDLVYVSCNEAYARDLGIAPAKIAGRTDADLFSRAIADAHRANDALTMESGEVTECEEETIVGGETRAVHTVRTPVRDEQARPVGVLGISWDITDRKRAEQERETLAAHLRQAQKMEAVGQLAGGIAHDFNNILTAILANAELALLHLRGTSAPRQKAIVNSLQEMKDAGNRAAGLTRQLLTFSRGQITQAETIDLNQTLRGIEKLLRRLISEEIELRLTLAPELRGVEADDGLVEQILMNLVVNARDAMPAGGILSIETRDTDLDEAHAAAHAEAKTGPHVMLVVSDTGRGMDEATLERIFEPFFTTKEIGAGTGLGLATVYGIVKQAGGHTTVHSELGRGSIFRIYLPAVEAQPSLTPEPAERGDGLPGTESILVCEDDEQVRRSTVLLLQEAGYTVVAASSGSEARRLAGAREAEIQLLVTDVIMPGMNGKQLSDTLRASMPELRTLFISGYTADIISQHGVDDEATGFLEKPFDRRAFLQKVRELLDAP